MISKIEKGKKTLTPSQIIFRIGACVLLATLGVPSCGYSQSIDPALLAAAKKTAASDPAECARLAKDMGDKSIMILRNHDGITTGKTVCEAFIASYYLEKACQFQILAQSAGVPLAMPADEIIAASGGRPAGDDRAWPSLLRMLDREDPSYRD